MRWKTLEGFFLGLSLVLLSYVGYVVAEREIFQARERKELRHLTRPASPPQAIDSSLVGSLTIPRVGVSAIVVKGVDDSTLDRAIGHIPGTAFPGQPGNVGVAAHRDTFFRGLRNVRGDDEISIDTPHGEYRYKVESTKIVKPENVSVLAPTSYSTLTLITCYPFGYIGHAPKRFIVRARQIDPQPETLEGHAPPTGPASQPALKPRGS